MIPALFIAASLATPPSQADVKACAAAQVSNDFEAWSSYLTAHPAGICARAPAAADVADCMRARTDGDPEIWTAYAALYPTGFCIGEATAVLHDAATRPGAPTSVDAPPSTSSEPPHQRVGGAMLSTGPTTTTGALDAQAIAAVLTPLEAATHTCGSGTARLFFTVTAAGDLATLEIEGVDEPTRSCLDQRLSPHMVFPSAPGPTRAVHHLALDEAHPE